MKLTEILELEGVEYTLTLNRESAVAINKYIDLQKSSEILSENIFKTKSEDVIREDENPFENIDKEIADMESLANKKEEETFKLVSRSLWIWMYPVHNFSYDKVKEILDPVFKDGDKLSLVMDKIGSCLEKSANVTKEVKEEDDSKNQIAN